MDSVRRDRRLILYGVTAGVTARAFLAGQLRFLMDEGWQVHLVCGESGLADFALAEGGVELHHVPMSRQPAPGDPLAVLRLLKLLRGLRPLTVVMGTPKMGVLGIFAAFASRVPNRIYLVHGLRAEGVHGVRGSVLRLLERLACSLATVVVPVSASLREKLIAEGLVGDGKAVVLGQGSANGVDVERFQPTDCSQVEQVRADLGVPIDAKIVAFVGRLTRDKGIAELAALWESFLWAHPDCWLLVAGREEPINDADRAALARLKLLPQTVLIGYTSEVQLVYQAADAILVLSSREGLGMVALEAAACEVPTIAWKSTGVIDAVANEATGFICPWGNLEEMQDRLHQVLSDPALRARLGRQARRRVVQEFERTRVWRTWKTLLEELSQGSPASRDLRRV